MTQLLINIVTTFFNIVTFVYVRTVKENQKYGKGIITGGIKRNRINANKPETVN